MASFKPGIYLVAGALSKRAMDRTAEFALAKFSAKLAHLESLVDNNEAVMPSVGEPPPGMAQPAAEAAAIDEGKAGGILDLASKPKRSHHKKKPAEPPAEKSESEAS